MSLASTIRRWLTVGLVGASLALLSGTASADSRGDFKRAQMLYEQGKYSDALPLFESVVGELRSPNAALYVARCLRDMGRLAEAYEAMSAAKALATARAADEPRYAKTRDAVAAESALLEQSIARVVISAAYLPEGASVLLNGTAIDPAKLGKIIAVAPGDVVVTALATGHTVAPVARSVAAGSMESLVITFEVEQVGVGEDLGWITPMRLGGIGAGAVGVGGFVMFAIAGTAAQSKFDDLDAQCGGITCDSSRAEEVSDGRTLQTVANVGLAIGIGGIAIGTVLTILGAPDDPSGAAVDVDVSPDGAWFGYRARF